MSKNNYEEVAQFRSGEVVAVVTEHIPTKKRSVMFAKEYARNGEIVRTSFLNSRHMSDVLELITQVQAEL